MEPRASRRRWKGTLTTSCRPVNLLAGGAGQRILYDLNGLGEGDLTSKGNRKGGSLRSMDLCNKNNQLSFRARQSLRQRGSGSQNNAAAVPPSLQLPPARNKPPSAAVAVKVGQLMSACRSSSSCRLPVVVRPISEIDTPFHCAQ